MGMTRRGFLTGLLGLTAAPAICKAGNLMKIVVPNQSLVGPFGADFDGDVISSFTPLLDKGSFSRRSPTSLGGDTSMVFGRGMTPPIFHIDESGLIIAMPK